MKNILFGIAFFAALPAVFAQKPAAADTTRYQGAWAIMEVLDGDTIFYMTLRQVRISARRDFKDREEQRLYERYKRAAQKVYPFAVQAIDLYNELMDETQDMSKRKRKKHVKKTQKELKEDFKDQLKQLSKTQGKVLIKMIERQIGKPFFEIIDETRGGMTAMYWHNLGKIWGYDLKEGYLEGDDPLLDAVLLDYDFSTKIYQNWKG